MVKKLLPKKDEDIKESETEPEEIEEIKTKPKKSKKEIIISESSSDSEELEKSLNAKLIMFKQRQENKHLKKREKLERKK